MGPDVDLDHTSFAVHDASAWARRLRRELGAVPVVGEALAQFRYLLLYIGTADEGARLELLEPVGDGFLSRYLAKHGEGPHHVTFTVPDLAAAVRAVRDLGLTVVGESYENAAWQEAFVVPDAIHGIVIQLSSSDRGYPLPSQLCGSNERDPASYPTVAGATQPLWWTQLWETPVEASARLGATHLASTDLALSQRLFADVLEGQVSESEQGLRFSWANGAVQVRLRGRPGLVRMDLHGGSVSRVKIGSTLLGRE